MRIIKSILVYLMTISSLLSFEEGKPLPLVTLRDGEQKFYQLNKLIGKPLVLMAFNLECKFCDPEILLLNDINAKYPGKIHIFLINSDPISRKSEVINKLKKLNSTLPILFDKNQDYTEGVSFPFTIITDSNLIIKSISNGFNEETQNKLKLRFDEVIPKE